MWLDEITLRVTGGMRALLAVAAMACACMALPGVASAAVTTGSIEGEAIEAGLAKQPIVGLCVSAYRPGERFYEENLQVTGAGGKYKIEDLAEGSYDVRFFKCAEGYPGGNSSLNFVPRYYKEQSVAANAETVEVKAGKTTEDINVEMHAGAEINVSVQSVWGI